MSDLDRLLQQVEELKRLALRPDDSWMNNMSNDELQALGKRVRKVADGLSGIQTQLAGSVGGGSGPARTTPRPPVAAGSLGSMVKRNPTTSPRPPQPLAPGGPAKPSARSLFPGPGPGGGPPMDLSNPMARKRVGGASIPREAPPLPPPPAAPFRPNLPSQTRKPGDNPPRGRNRPSI